MFWAEAGPAVQPGSLMFCRLRAGWTRAGILCDVPGQTKPGKQASNNRGEVAFQLRLPPLIFISFDKPIKRIWGPKINMFVLSWRDRQWSHLAISEGKELILIKNAAAADDMLGIASRTFAFGRWNFTRARHSRVPSPTKSRNGANYQDRT